MYMYLYFFKIRVVLSCTLVSKNIAQFIITTVALLLVALKALLLVALKARGNKACG